MTEQGSRPAVPATPVEQVGAAVFDNATAAPHDPALYAHGGLADTLAGLDALDTIAVARYRQDGFLAIEPGFSTVEIAAALDGLTDLLMGCYPDFKGIQFERSARAQLATMSLEERQDAVRKLMGFTAVEPRLDALARHPRLLAAVRRLLGAEPAMFQDMALLKPPRGREKPWHQDHAYFDFPLGTPIVGVWIALDAATPENGCMRMIPGSHHGGPVVHFQRRDWQICDTDIHGRPIVAVPLLPGGLLLFDGLCQHGTPYNPTGARRRAVQFHYAPVDAVRGSEAERLAVFGSEGKNVEC
ncbi:MAG: phytanoyl-CoA dioxygenase family protein [Chloroflexi bacterium]|nr:phytanoyl-CoA dioxygenase family protein [Chloroflexota bacterium]